MTNLQNPEAQRNHPRPRQLELPLLYAPSIVKNHGLRAAHPRPLVSLGKVPGAPYSSWRVSPKRAWSFAQLEYANAGSSWAALVLDCDNPRKMGGLLDLPPPNWTVTRVSNGHAHAAWTLASPVHKYSAAKIEPQRYFAAIADYYAETVGADPGYSGILAHNPAPRMRDAEFTTTWGGEKPYELGELANVIPFNWSVPTVRQTGVGRNCDLFQSGMRWAGRQANTGTGVLVALTVANQDFAHPLPDSEIAAMAKSIGKYRDRWAAHGWHRPRWISRQAARGKAGGSSRAKLDAWEATSH